MGQAIPNCTNMCTRAEKRGEYEVDDAETKSRKYKQKKNDILEKAKSTRIKTGDKSQSDFLSGGGSNSNNIQKEKEKNIRKAIRMFRQENQAIRIQRAYWRFKKNKDKKSKPGKKIEDRYGEKQLKNPDMKMRLIDSENLESLYEKKEDFTFSEKKPVYSIREKPEFMNMDDVQIDSSTKEDQLRGDLISLNNNQGRTFIDNSDKKARTERKFESMNESYKSPGPKKHSVNSYSKVSNFSKSPNKGYSMKVEKNIDSGTCKVPQSFLEDTNGSKYILTFRNSYKIEQ